ncbi:MAG TPA: NADH:flavin oxidoreductase [Firmicutes bacterium]|nr:NADH:flavin oxidoreductase [Candidatus Fermentithermobacillaceae bacterium]
MSLLFSPIKVGNLTLRNRIVMPPMATAIEGPGGSREDTGLPSDATVAYYAERAKKDVGMVIVEHTYIAKQGKAHKGQLGLDSDAAIPAFERLAQAIRTNGAVAAIQLNHVGSIGNPDVTGHEVVGPSDKPHPKSERKPRGLTAEEIREIQSLFAAAARRAKLAGFDAVEVHSAHGYLGSQFLSPITNTRTDEYGGSLENRARFLLETVSRVKAEVGSDFPVFVRLGSVDGMEGGFTPEEAAQVARMLEEAGVALVDVSGGFMGSRPAGAPPGYFVPAAATIKKAVNVPVMVTGGITEAAFAEKVLQDGHADLIGIGRALLRDPNWVIKAKEYFQTN